jgi:integrase
VRDWVDPEGRVFGERPAVDITGTDAAALLAACREGAPRTSTMVAIKMHQCWDYGMTLEILPDKRNIWKGQIRPKIKKKDRHLSETELVKVGERLASCGETEDCIIGYKLFLLAGMRHRNLAHARWEWVDLDHRRMLVPPEQHKTGHRTHKPLAVYLSTHAVTLLKQLKCFQDADKDTKGSPWLYPKRGDKKGHRDDLGDPWERIRKDQSWSDVNIHDLRRTLASMLSTLGYKGYAGEVLGHAGTSVTDIYTHTAPNELLAMLDKAGDRIMGLLEGRMKPNSGGALIAPAPGSTKALSGSETGEPPIGAKASRMHQPQKGADRPKPKAKLFIRKGE